MPALGDTDKQRPNFPLFPIAGWKGKLRFGQRVSPVGLKLSRVENLEGTTYGDWALADPLYRTERADWVYHDTQIDQGDLIVIWTPPVWSAAELATLTEAERARGRLLKRFNISRQASMPPVLDDLQVEYSAAEGTQTRRKYQEDVSVSCTVQVTKYVTDIPPSRHRARCNEPIPGEIHGTFNGHEVHFPSCLHPRIEITNVTPADVRVIDCTPDRRSVPPGPTRIFEATNFQRLAPHVFDKDIIEDGDLYFITEYKVRPPRGIPRIDS